MCIRDSAKKYRQEKPQQYYRTQRRALYKRYGLTEEQYSRMHAVQNGCCAICKSPFGMGSTKAQIDHCHASKTVRALLCQSCNIALGNFRESEAILLMAIDYLKLHKTTNKPK